LKLGVLLAGRRPEDIAQRFAHARDAGFSLCQLNIHQAGISRADLAAVADSMVEFGVRPVAVGCYLNPMRPDEPSAMGTTRADLDTVLHALDIIGARRVVFHSGTHAASLYDSDEANATEESLEELRAFVLDIVANTKARHYTLVIEPWHCHVLGSEDRVIEFHSRLPPAASEHVRYVLDPTNLVTPETYADRDRFARAVCRSIGKAAGVVHLKDCIMPPDGEAALPGPGQGKLDYGAYLEAIQRHVPPDTPAVVRNVPPPEFASVRDFLLRLSEQWELA
jgi:sugar phosphate isomerase/epimerase